MQFEVRVPAVDGSSRMRLVVVEAKDWFSALRNALKEVGESTQLRNVLCDLVEDGVYQVTQSEGGRTFEIREMMLDEDSLEFAAPERVTLDAAALPGKTIEQVEATMENLPSVNSPEDMAKTEINMPSFSESIGATPAATKPPRRKAKKELASTMAMDFAAIIEAQSTGEKDPYGETVEFNEYASREELEMEKPSIIVSEDAYTPVPVSKERRATVREEPAVTPAQAAAVTPAPPSKPKDDSLSDLTGAEGQYKPGMTTEMLADVFMRASEIHDHGEDRAAAISFVLELALGDVKALGGMVLLTDINSPEQVLWVEAVRGPKAQLMKNFRIPLGQGIIGYYTQQGINQSVPDVRKESSYSEDALSGAGLDIGPMLVAPISYSNRIWGSVVLFNQAGERAFTQGELSILTYLAYTTGEYLSALS